MKYKINIIDIIIIWVCATLFTFVLVYFVIGQEESTLKSILAAIYWLAPFAILSILNKKNVKELINYIRKNHPQDYEKYAYSKFWEMDRAGFKFQYYYLFQESDSDEILNDMKNQILYIWFFILFHVLFCLLFGIVVNYVHQIHT